MTSLLNNNSKNIMPNSLNSNKTAFLKDIKESLIDFICIRHAQERSR